MNTSRAEVIALPVTPEARSFEALFKTNYARLARLIYRVIGDTGRAEELAAEVFWRLHSKPPSSRENIEGWLYRTAIHGALDNLRAETRRSRYESLSPPPSQTEDPEQTPQRRQERDRVRSVLSVLRPEFSELLLLRSEGCSYAELAAALQMNPASVGTLLARAEAAFRKEYEERYGQQ